MTKEEIEEAKKAIAEQDAKDLEDCVKEVNEAEMKYLAPIYEKYGCKKKLALQLVEDRITVHQIIDKIK